MVVMIGGWGEPLDREIVSFRSCVRTRGVPCLVGTSLKRDPPPFPFSLCAREAFPFPFFAMACPFYLEIESEIKVNSLRNPM